MIDALRNKYRLHILLEILHMTKSSYCYQEAALHKPDKYADLSLKVQAVFNESKGRYGYRRIHAIIIGSGYTVSEKVIRHIIDLLTKFNDDDEIEIEVYDTTSGKFVDVTCAVTFVDDAISPTLKIDIEAEKFRKFLPPERSS